MQMRHPRCAKASIRAAVWAIILPVMLANQTAVARWAVADAGLDLEPVLKECQQDGLVMIATLSWAMMGLFHNWRCSLQLIGIHRPVLIFAQDRKTQKYVESLGHRAVLSPSAHTDLSLRTFNTSAYHMLVEDRLRFLIAVLSTDVDIVTIDIDAVWRMDPIPFIDRQADISAPLELKESMLASALPGDSDGAVTGKELCACFLFLSAKGAAAALLAEALGLLQDQRFQHNEQKAMSYLLLPDVARNRSWASVTVQWLPKPQFPSGREYFGLHVHRERGYNNTQKRQVVVLHNNWIKTWNKGQRFRQHHFWFARRDPQRRQGGHSAVRCTWAQGLPRREQLKGQS